MTGRAWHTEHYRIGQGANGWDVTRLDNGAQIAAQLEFGEALVLGVLIDLYLMDDRCIGYHHADGAECQRGACLDRPDLEFAEAAARVSLGGDRALTRGSRELPTA